MSSVVLSGNTSGAVTLAVPDVAGTNTITLPASTGTVALTSQVPNGLTSGTAVASTSGTSIDFTSIPSWVKRITVMFRTVSANGSSIIQVQVGSGSVSTSGYLSSCGAINGGTGQAGSTAGIAVTTGLASSSNFSGFVVFSSFGSNQWIASGNSQYTNDPGAIYMSAGYTPTLSGALDRVRITTVNGTDAFDAGLINILYE
jgi:hypothetical protein